MVRLRPRGAATRDPESAADPLFDALEQHPELVRVIDAFDVEAPPRTRDASPAVPTVVQVRVPAASGDDLLLVREESTGLWHWELPQPGAVRSPYAAAPTHFDLALDAPPPAAGKRGVFGRVAGRVARVLVLRVTDELLAKGAQRLAELFEQRSRKGGLRGFTAADYLSPRPDEADQLRSPDVEGLGAGASLLFLHGTMALAHTGFTRLPSDLLERLSYAYEGRVWAYDHHTLSKTPAQNAADLVGRLRQLNSPHLVVDVIAHSRGGLVARELAALQQRGSLVEVRSVLFVATPNTGTPICDPNHLQRLIDRYTNLFALVPDNPVTDLIDAVSSVAAAVALRAVGGLVGLNAMDPNGPYQQELAARSPRRGIRYRAICSDFDPSAGTGLTMRLRDLAMDHVFDGVPNDLIVPTDSAFGANGNALVAEADRYVFARDRGVDHSSFWDRPEFAQRIEEWLPVAVTARSGSSVAVDAGALAGEASGTATATAVETTEEIDDDYDDSRQIVRIAAVHASLEHAAHPLIVGHFRGVALQGAGQFLDARLGGRLSTRLMLGLLP
ncbi:MAG: esterase/lipase family protein, partial [Acidimicrobiia bacterium]